MTSNTPCLSFSGVSKSFVSRDGEIVRAVENVTFDVPRGTVACLVGMTGCGKTTILRLAAGLETPDSGTIVSPSGEIGYLTQQHTLLPWMTTTDNIGLPLKVKGMNDAARKARVNEIMEALGLAGFGSLYPYELSGGMRQRAAIGRLMASESSCWLLDEPFSSLDERTRHQLQKLLLETAAATNVTVLFVTHSIDEAVWLADRIYIVSAWPGRIIESLEIAEPKPRDRISDAFGARMEAVRKRLEAAIG
ncbi:MAG: ABC transporter ATP-binding protein [Nitrospirae bacterium]|nr:ABC transporter ATP-binding protein [Nitrospirota bacterium]